MIKNKCTNISSPPNNEDIIQQKNKFVYTFFEIYGKIKLILGTRRVNRMNKA